MIAPGVTMNERTARRRRDRPIFFDIIVIGLAIVALMYGGLRLLSRTHDAWDARYGEKRPTSRQALAATEPQRTQGWTAADDEEYFRLKAEAAERKKRHEANTRCINGTLFRIEGSSYTNIGRC